MSKKKICVVAITGNIGSGKTSFSKFLAEHNFPVLNADDISKQLLASDANIKNEIIKIFGSSAYKNGKPDYSFLSEKVFSKPENVLKMNSLLHPAVQSEINKRINLLRENYSLIFVEAALIYEADMEKNFNYVVLISADKSIRMQRILKSKNLSSEQFELREQNQIPESEKRKRADFVFENNEDLENLKSKAELFLNLITSMV